VWAGYRDDVPRLLAGADLFVLPSLDDAFPTVLLEAMAAELPVVATHVGGIPEIVDSADVGVLVPPGDVAALADAIEALLRDEERRRRIAAAGRRRVAQEFSTERWTERLMTLYRSAP
jgi:glycosyltransferase involved in cell wall biosynthesis